MFFERFTFESLTLHQNDIHYFGEIVKGHRKTFVRHIWLRLELLEYDCPKCKEVESEAETNANNKTFSVAVYSLFNIIGQWGEGEGEGGVELELSAHSPSDSEHHFKELAYRSTGPKAGPLLPGSVQYHDPMHGWDNGRGLYNFPLRLNNIPNHYARPFGPGLRFSYRRRKLCLAPSVNSFRIRRQFYRSFSIQNGIGRILEALPNLEHFSYEPWSSGHLKSYVERCEYEHSYLISNFLQFKPSLKTVSIFQDFGRPLNGSYTEQSPVGSESSTKFAMLSLGLERMYGSFAVDAGDFFSSIEDLLKHRNPVQWDRLQVLVLTSRILKPKNNKHVYDGLFRSAARGVAHMPKLRRLELWSGGFEHGCLFRYKVDKDGRPTITLMSTWFCRMSPKAILAWEEVVRVHALEHKLEVRHVDLDRARMTTHGTILQYLTREPHGVISDRSRDELLKESIWGHAYGT